MYAEFNKNNRSNICMELQSFHNLLAVIALTTVVIELVTFFRKFPKPSELAFSTLINFSVIDFVVFERGFRNPKNYFSTRNTSLCRATVTCILLV